MRHFWVTNLPLSVGSSYELFQDGMRVAHIMHYKGGGLKTILLIDTEVARSGLELRKFRPEPGLSRLNQVQLRGIIQQCQHVSTYGDVDLFAYDYGVHPPAQHHVEQILLAISLGLRRRCGIWLDYLTDPERGLNTSKPRLPPEDVPKGRGAQYRWHVANARWHTAPVELATQWAGKQTRVDLGRFRRNLSVRMSSVGRAVNTFAPSTA